MSEINIGNIQVNRTLGVGTANIPLLKGDKGDTGYSISRIERTSGDGTPGTTDTYTIYIDTTPESALATFTVYNGIDGGGDMTKSVYDTNDNGIVDNAEQVNGHTVGIDVPSNAVFTDTVYDDTTLSGRVTTLEGAGYITKNVNDLTNYYLKTEVYNKTEIDTLVGDIESLLASI